MLSFLKRKSKTKNTEIHGANDDHVTRFFAFNRAWIANERIAILTPIMVVGLAGIGYATFALSLNSPAGYVDSPAANSIVSGANASITGWAVAASPIDHVDIVVNGIAARASYGTGGPRQDVCNLYPQSPNCAGSAQVGWQFYFNSTSMPNAVYSLYANIYGSSGGFTSTPIQYFTVQNNGPFGNIDTPAESQTVTGTINVGGWALDNATAISRVTMSIDGVPNAYYPIYGASRPDVCASYPGRPSCPNPGFNYTLDTTAIPNGWKVMHITLYDSDGIQRSATMDRTVYFNNTATPPPVVTGPGTTPPAPPSLPAGGAVNPDGYVDDPKPSTTAAPKSYSGKMTIDGWAVDLQSAISKVNVYVDGVFAGTAKYGTGGTRADICASHAGWSGCPAASTAANLGWQLTYDSTGLTNGSHKVFARITDSDASAHYFNTQTITFNVSNAAPPPPPPATGLPPVNPPSTTNNLPPDVYIDAINDPGTVTTTANGWAIDNITKAESAIKKVSVSLNGKVLGNAVYGGSRPDVCTKYPGRAGCTAKASAVGWNITFDSSSVPAGTSTLQATATDATGLTKTTTKTFTANTTSGSTTGGGSGGGGGGSAAVARFKLDRNPDAKNRIHVIYAVPEDSDGKGGLLYDRHLDTTGAISNTMTGVQNWLCGQTKTSSGCTTLNMDTTTGLAADVTFAQLQYKVADLNKSKDLFATLASEINFSASPNGPNGTGLGLVRGMRITPGMSPSKKYIIFYEGPYQGVPGVCGITSSAGGISISIIPLRGGAGGGANSFNCFDDGLTYAVNPHGSLEHQLVVLHETMHMLGAVAAVNPNNVANCVNYVPAPVTGYLGGHVTDLTDLMNPAINSSPAANKRLDIGGNSYWGSNVKGGCNNVPVYSKAFLK